jgi:DNA-binding protein H-NS
MAKKTAKKTPQTHLIENFKKLTVSSQAILLLELGKLYEKAKISRLGMLKAEIEELSAPKPKAAKISRVKVTPKYRSKKDKKMTWSGRGSVPRWMREEMKSLRVKQDAFLIRK